RMGDVAKRGLISGLIGRIEIFTDGILEMTAVGGPAQLVSLLDEVSIFGRREVKVQSQEDLKLEASREVHVWGAHNVQIGAPHTGGEKGQLGLLGAEDTNLGFTTDEHHPGPALRINGKAKDSIRFQLADGAPEIFM